jgi:uncharacterized membrane protein YphA (DoxX/SURF4 family)
MSSAWISTDRTISTARIFYAVGLIGIGFQHFFFAQFIPMVVPLWPTWIPGRPICVYLVGLVLILSGVSILSGFKARLTATLLGGLFLLSVILLHIPGRFLSGELSLGAWSNTLKALAFAGSSFVVASTFPDPETDDGRRQRFPIRLLEKLIPYGEYALAVMVIVFGTDHFLYTAFVATLVPAWIPWHVFWTYFAGIALIASGLAILVGIVQHLAATMLGAMMFAWVFILHIPRAFTDPYGAIGNEWTSVFEALALSGIAFILGQTLPIRNAHLLFKSLVPQGRSEQSSWRNRMPVANHKTGVSGGSD